MINKFWESKELTLIKKLVSEPFLILHKEKSYGNLLFKQLFDFDTSMDLEEEIKGEEIYNINKMIKNNKKIDIKGKRFKIESIDIDFSVDKLKLYKFKILKQDEIEDEYKKLRFEMDIIDEFIENAYEGIVIVDKNGYITKFKYEKLLGIKEKDVLGKHVSEVIENTRIPKVLVTGQSELGEIQTINNRDVITTRIPIRRNGEIIGAIGTVLFKDIKELKYWAKRIEKLQNKVNKYEGEINRINSAKYTFENIITKNQKMKYIKDIAKKASETNATVLLEGESGTGKEYFAHAIHQSSYRKYGPFIRINCAAIPNNLLESEFFGYEEGSFTGASKNGRIGKFELANGGTIFLDEISSMPLEMQAKILRVLEEKEFERIGGNKKIELDVRIIAATNEDLEELIKINKFREDLYYRLNVINISIPRLSDRKEDIAILADQILKNFQLSYGNENKKHKISKDVYKALTNYYWPGNVRELRNILERAITINRGSIIYLSDLPKYIREHKNTLIEFNQNVTLEIDSLKEELAKAEIEIIKKAILICSGNKTEASKVLKIHRTSLYKKLEKYEV